MQIQIPYGHTRLACDVPDEQVKAVLSPLPPAAVPEDPVACVREAMEHPIGSPRLEELARGKRRVTVIASDHTRPVPSRVLMPLILAAIRRGNPEAEITILIATGCHRGTTKAELVAKFGEEIVSSERIVIHDCEDEAALVRVGTLPSGGPLVLNRLAVDTDLLVSEGFIEPHFFAGFSGGRKSVLPGVASRACVHANHNAAFIDDPKARMGVLEGNPIHRDMLYAARAAKLAFIVNVVLNAEGQILGAFAGDCEAAHVEGTRLVSRLMRRDAAPADVVFTSNNGYPLDQNLYQMVKGMCTAEATCRPGGVIIAVGECSDGIGGEAFARMLREYDDMEQLLAVYRATPAEATVTDQWQVQILARILTQHKVILVSALDPKTVASLHMIPAASLQEAYDLAVSLSGKEKPEVTAIPEGISVIL